MKHMPQAQNQVADSQATLVSLQEKGDQKLTQLVILIRNKISYYEGLVVTHVDLEGEGKWYVGIQRYLKVREYPKSANKRDRAIIHRLATQFTLVREQLYILLCVIEKQAEEIMKEIHAGMCGPHMNKKVLV